MRVIVDGIIGETDINLFELGYGIIDFGYESMGVFKQNNVWRKVSDPIKVIDLEEVK